MKINFIKIKLILLILISYIISNLLIREVFLANSPTIRPNLKEYLALKVKNSLKRLSNNIAYLINIRQTSSFNNQITTKNIDIYRAAIIEKLKNKSSIPLSRGVYAKTDRQNTLIEIDTSQMDFIEYTFNIKGKLIKIKVPKGEQPPSQQVVEALYK